MRRRIALGDSGQARWLGVFPAGSISDYIVGDWGESQPSHSRLPRADAAARPTEDTAGSMLGASENGGKSANVSELARTSWGQCHTHHLSQWIVYDRGGIAFCSRNFFWGGESKSQHD